jgi:ubiquinone/menaquinone biosynthesis C-methylase UbiE
MQSPLIQRSFAWGIEQVMRWYEPQIAERKRQLFSQLHGTVVEIGPGTGPNLKYMSRDVDWIGIESNPHMRKFLEKEAQRLGMPVHLIDGSALSIPLDDHSADFVVGTLVLCSVPCPVQTLDEVRRVLKPGGRYLFIEHVAAPEGSAMWRVQQFIKPLWKCCADGCHVDRRSWEPIEGAGFGRVQLERFNLNFPVVSPHIMGMAMSG